jgi:predicted NUDIX family NTP pyrophosphohydrolase
MAEIRYSAGLLMYTFTDQRKLRVLLVHPGRPFAMKQDNGRWSIPKGELNKREDLLACARREFSEETGHEPPASGPFHSLGTIRQRGGKHVIAWAFEGIWIKERFSSNLFEMEWPIGSGKNVIFPEIDRAELFSIKKALHKIKPAQIPLIRKLCEILELQSLFNQHFEQLNVSVRAEAEQGLIL